MQVNDLKIGGNLKENGINTQGIKDDKWIDGK